MRFAFRGLSLVILVLVLANTIPLAEGATQIASKTLTFDDWTWYSQKPGITWQQSWNDSYKKFATVYFTTATPVYFNFLYAKVSHKYYDGANAYIERRVLIKVFLDGTDITNTLLGTVHNGEFYDGSYEFYIPLTTTVQGKNLTIEFWTSTGDVVNYTGQPIVNYTIDTIKVLFSPTEGGFTYNTRAVDNIQIPAGANSSKALSLNRTQIYLSNELLTAGSASFYIKWDGHPVNVTNFLEVKEDGTIIVYGENTDGQRVAYTTTLKLTANTWERVYLSWKSGEMYVMLNDKNHLNDFQFSGGIRTTQIGDITQDTGTLIDTFAYWKVYMSPDDFLASVQGMESYEVKVGQLSLSVTPEGGLSLPPLQVSFLDANQAPLGDVTTVSTTNPSISAPSGTAYILLSSSTPQVQRMYLISNMSGEVHLGFPASDVTELMPVTVTVPSGYTTLAVYTADGTNALVYRGKIKSGTGSFVAIPGHYYRFEITGENMTPVTAVYQVSSQVVSLGSSDIASALKVNQSKEGISAEFDPTSNVVKASYYNPHNSSATVVVTYFNANNTALSNTTFTVSPNGIWVWNGPMPPGVAYLTIHVKSEGLDTTKTIQGSLLNKGWLNEHLLPSGLILILIATVGAFAVNRENAGYSTMLMLILLTITAFAGLVSLDYGVVALLSVLAVAGVYTSREG